MPQIEANGIQIEVELSGPSDGVPILLTRGLGTQLIQWPKAFLAELERRGFRIARFDNRDVGLSQFFDEAGVPQIADVMAARQRGEAPNVPYTLEDMADDAAGVIAHLRAGPAHVFGMSMGGMIAQHVAARHPGLTRSLISVMSSSGDPSLPGPTPEAAAMLVATPDPPDDRDANVELGVKARHVFGSPGFREPEENVRAECAAAFDRSRHPDGVTRQLIAVLADSPRRKLLRKLRIPSLVIHGRDDPLVPVAAGIDTAEHIEGARLEIIDGMGHDIPSGLAVRIAGLVGDFASSVDA